MRFLLASIDRARKNVAVVCLTATLVISIAAAAHAHLSVADDGNAAGHCLLCVVAHAPGLITGAAASIPQPHNLHRLVIAAAADHRSRLVVSDLFIRPPPSLI